MAVKDSSTKNCIDVLINKQQRQPSKFLIFLYLFTPGLLTEGATHFGRRSSPSFNFPGNCPILTQSPINLFISDPVKLTTKTKCCTHYYTTPGNILEG